MTEVLIPTKDAAVALGVNVKTMQIWNRKGVFRASQTIAGNNYYTQDQIDQKRNAGYRVMHFVSEEGTKECSKCHGVYPVSNFYVNQDRPTSCCKGCTKEKRDNTRLPQRYGITNEQYNKMIEVQENCCGVCGKQGGTTKSTKLHIDHDHKTGKVRGLLCVGCNMLVGFVEKNEVTTAAAQEYVLAHKEWDIPDVRSTPVWAMKPLFPRSEPDQ